MVREYRGYAAVGGKKDAKLGFQRSLLPMSGDNAGVLEGQVKR